MRRLVCALLLAPVSSLFAAPPRPLAAEPLVDVKKVAPSIVIDLRYATDRNISHKPIYPRDMGCLVRAGVAERLRAVQYVLHSQGFGLKIWDGYRPVYAQQLLFQLIQRPEFIADPAKGGALHTWGVAVDATLVDAQGQDVPMPTDFDEFSHTASMHYAGHNIQVAQNLDRLQRAMSLGFYGMHGEWWHFIAKNWTEYGPVLPPRVQR